MIDRPRNSFVPASSQTDPSEYASGSTLEDRCSLECHVLQFEFQEKALAWELFDWGSLQFYIEGFVARFDYRFPARFPWENEDEEAACTARHLHVDRRVTAGGTIEECVQRPGALRAGLPV